MSDTVHKKNIDYLTKAVAYGKFADFILSKDVDISYFKSGGGNHLYLMEAANKKYLARINYYHLKNEWKIKRHEFEILSLIKNFNIAPHPYYLDDTKSELSQHYIIVEYIEGNELKDVKESTILELADVLKKLHSSHAFETTGDRLPPTDPPPYFCGVYNEFALGEDKQIEQYNELENIEIVIEPYNQIKKRLGTWFSSFSIFQEADTFVLCHADLKLENIVASPTGIHLIDWEGAGIDIPETDIGRLFSGATFTPSQEDMFLNKYYNNGYTDIQVERIRAIRRVLDFFRIIEDYILLKRKPWDAEGMVEKLKSFDNTF